MLFLLEQLMIPSCSTFHLHVDSSHLHVDSSHLHVDSSHLHVDSSHLHVDSSQPHSSSTLELTAGCSIKRHCRYWILAFTVCTKHLHKCR